MKVVDTELGKVGGLIWYCSFPNTFFFVLIIIWLGELHASSQTCVISAGDRVGSQIQIQSVHADQIGLYRIYIAPHADDLPTWIASMQHIAKEGRCFVISVNQFCKVSWAKAWKLERTVKTEHHHRFPTFQPTIHPSRKTTTTGNLMAHHGYLKQF